MILDKIHLSWRKGRGYERRIIGEIYRYGIQGYTFNYMHDGLKEAQQEGFINYPEFPDLENINHVYTQGIKEIFSLRLIPEGRSDRKPYLSFWEADNPDYDWFDQLALTQGILPTDNFEFLGVYNPNKVHSFVTDIANLSERRFERNTVELGERLTYEINNSDHDYSGKCVKVFNRGHELGYIKKIHNIYFIEAEKKNIPLELTVKAIDQNGVIKSLYAVVRQIV